MDPIGLGIGKAPPLGRFSKDPFDTMKEMFQSRRGAVPAISTNIHNDFHESSNLMNKNLMIGIVNKCTLRKDLHHVFTNIGALIGW